MKYSIAYCFFLFSLYSFSQDGISRVREFSYDLDNNGSMDKAYCTLEKGDLYSSIQVEIYFYDENDIINECISKKIIFETNSLNNNSEQIYLTLFNHQAEDNSIMLLFHQNKIDYFFSFVYDNYDFDLLYYTENDKKEYFRYFRQIDFREKKIYINKVDPESNENSVNKFPYTKNNIPKLSDFEFGSITWPSVK